MQRVLFLLVFIFICSCTKKSNSLAYSDNDPFVETFTKSQILTVDLEKEQVIIAEDGTTISFAENSIVDEHGTPQQSFSMEIIENLSVEKMVLSNLTTTSNGQLLETDGMIFIDFFNEDRERLMINKAAPIYIEIPTEAKISGMQVYEGKRNKKGDMNWANPKKLNNYLRTVPLDSLDFLPVGYQEALQELYPKIKITKKIRDSIYFNTKIACSEPDQFFTELYYGGIEMFMACGVLPYRVKTILNPKFQESFIATRAFEKRLRMMRKYGECEIFDLYVNNLNRNLYELDSIVGSRIYEMILTEDEVTSDKYLPGNEFEQLAEERLLKVNNDDKHFKKLKQFYKQQEETLKLQLEQNAQDLTKLNKEEKEKAKALKIEIAKLNNKREAVRMPKYGFQATEAGWINIDRGIVPKDWMYKELALKIQDVRSYDFVSAYVLFSSNKIITRLKPNGAVFTFDPDLERVQVPKQENLFVVVVARKEEAYFFDIQQLNSGKDDGKQMELVANLNAKSLAEINVELCAIEKEYEQSEIVKSVRIDHSFGKLISDREKKLWFQRELKSIACPSDNPSESDGRYVVREYYRNINGEGE